jgi:hypothetical protein
VAYIYTHTVFKPLCTVSTRATHDNITESTSKISIASLDIELILLHPCFARATLCELSTMVQSITALRILLADTSQKINFDSVRRDKPHDHLKPASGSSKSLNIPKDCSISMIYGSMSRTACVANLRSKITRQRHFRMLSGKCCYCPLSYKPNHRWPKHPS